MRLSDDTRIIDLTLGQLKEIIKELLPGPEAHAPDEYVYGIEGLARVLGCSNSQARYIKRTGRYKAAIRQDGRKIITNATKLRALIPTAS